MRVLLVTLGSLLVSFMIFWTIKFWGKSQVYVPYSHPFYANQAQPAQPVIFVKPSFENLEAALNNEPHLYLNVLSTQDGQLILPKRQFDTKLKPARYANYADIKIDSILLESLKEKLASKKIIFNIQENANAGHVIFFEELKKAGLQKGENFIVTSPYEAIAHSLKELAPTYLYGSTQPEILKIAAMKAMGLIEALTLRADVVIHPLLIRNREFFDDELIVELHRRHKRFIVGPIDKIDMERALALKPFGIIVNQ